MVGASIIANVCMYSPIYVYMYIYICMYAYVYVYAYLYVYVCMYVCMYACMYLSMYVCMYVCICVCVYVYMYVCMYVCMHVCVYLYYGPPFLKKPWCHVLESYLNMMLVSVQAYRICGCWLTQSTLNYSKLLGCSLWFQNLKRKKVNLPTNTVSWPFWVALRGLCSRNGSELDRLLGLRDCHLKCTCI